MNAIKKALSLTTLLLSLSGANCWAYYEILDNAELIEPGQYKVTGGLQALTDTGGANLTSIIDTGIQEDFGLRGIFGVGKTDFYFGGLIKWLPIPDTSNQPAIGFNVGFEYASWLSRSETTVRFEPLISKQLKMSNAKVTPYASIPLGIRMRSNTEKKDQTRFTSQFVAGSQLELSKWRNMHFIGELGVNWEYAVSHVSVGAVFYFDGQNGFSLN